MFNSQMPDVSDLPTSRQLAGSTLFAAAAAAAILVAIILPSEYGLDPTGAGRLLGLTEMGETKVQLAQEAAASDAAASSIPVKAEVSAHSNKAGKGAASASASRRDELRVALAPGEGAEIKLSAAKDARIAFDWSVGGGRVNYDTHADAPGISYHGYGKGKASVGERGELIAAFDGSHGWFWRNRSDAPVTIVLRTNGAYSAIRRVV